MDRDYTPYQQKIIKRYYDNQDTIQRQRLAELVSELYLSEGKKRQRVWKNITSALEKLGYSQQRIEHLLKQDNPTLVAELVKELEKKKGIAACGLALASGERTLSRKRLALRHNAAAQPGPFLGQRPNPRLGSRRRRLRFRQNQVHQIAQ